MSEGLVHNIMDAISDNVSKHKKVSFSEDDDSSSVSCQVKKLFGREKPVHHILGGGKSADVLLWRNKKISAGVLGGATVVWVLFEWLNYNFLSLSCFALIIALLLQFLWTNASSILNRSSSSAPRVVLPEEVFVNIGKMVGTEVNRSLIYLQDVACEGTIKQFVVVVGSLLAAAIIGSWCNFLTVIYIGFIAAHTLPVLYEKYDDQIDNFILSALGQVQHNYGKLDAGVLKRIPRAGSFKNWGRKTD
ncbi:reticulon-like protein B8 isoform X2 [Salvia miltiorrhiza]|nr:reticulon-like protein B8 isoform X2 [Salvia miltiorrhiza]XP_057796742.1 reticulon-like protein B8 isoform X2 [Salvia miltiorrhiza]